MDPDAEIELDASPFARIYKSGRIERLPGLGVVPAGVDPAAGVASKDVLINPATGVSARIFLPSARDDADGRKKLLPVVVYFHGGAFIVQSPFSPTYHNYVSSLAASAKVVAVSVDYRLAPEHVLPAAYDDAWDSLQWAASGGGGDPWLAEHGDLGKLYLAGDSAGGNIVHNVALRVTAEGLPEGAAIEGLAMVHPSFWSWGGSEEVAELVRKKWRVACPDSPGPLEDPRLNPVAAEGAAERLRRLPGRRVLVAVAGEDLSWREGGKAYYEGLKRSGWEGKVEMVVSEGEKHVFHIFDRHCQNAVCLMEALVAFFSSD